MQRTHLLVLSTAMSVFFVTAGACQSGDADSTSGGPSSGVGLMVTSAATGGSGPGPGVGGAPTGGSGGTGGVGGTASGGAGGDGGAGGGGVVVLHETFDDASALALSDSAGATITFFSDGTDDYFGIADGLGGGLWNGNSPPSALKAYTGFTGSFLAAQDLDGEGGDEHVRVEWTGLDIAGLSELSFFVELAERNDVGGHIDQEDFIRVEVQLDGGGYTKILEFFSNAQNDVFREDVGLDGTADGLPLGNAASSFTKPITGTGTTLDVRLSIRLDAGHEDVGVDNVRVTGM